MFTLIVSINEGRNGSFSYEDAVFCAAKVYVQQGRQFGTAPSLVQIKACQVCVGEVQIEAVDGIRTLVRK